MQQLIGATRWLWSKGCLGKVVAGTLALALLGVLTTTCSVVGVATGVIPKLTPSPRPTTVEVAAAPTQAPAPTAAPTARPAATSMVAAAPNMTAQSRGMGLPREQWEALHGDGTKATIGFDYTGNFNVAYQRDPSGAEAVWMLEQRWPPVSLTDARAMPLLLIPTDSTRIKTYDLSADRPVDLYHSEWLKDRFPASMKIKDTALTMWPNGEPGDFTIMYRLEDDKVTSIVISIGDNP